MNLPLLSGKDVYLRHPHADDADEFVALRRASWHLHQPWEPQPPEGVDPTGKSAFALFLNSSNTDTCQRHLVCRRSDDAIVAYVGLSQIVHGAFCSCYMGYWTGAPYVRRGYAAAGIALVLERSFTRLGLHRVEANVVPENHASLAVVRRCGLRQEGYSPRYLQIAGEWRDHERWAITYEDWQAAESAASGA